jgi:hypothetical protein
LTEIFAFFGRPPYVNWGKRPFWNIFYTAREKWSDKWVFILACFAACSSACVSPIPKIFSPPIRHRWSPKKGKKLQSTKVNTSRVTPIMAVGHNLWNSMCVCPIRMGFFAPIRHRRSAIYGKGFGQQKSTHVEYRRPLPRDPNLDIS